MPKEFNSTRVVYYPPTDLACGYCKDRIIDILSTNDSSINDINEAIEIQQCKLYVECVPDLFDDEALSSMRKNADEKFSAACKFVNECLDATSLNALFDEVELQYISQFWQLISSTGAIGKIDESSLMALIAAHPNQLYEMLKLKTLVGKFDSLIGEQMETHPLVSAELIVGNLASASRSSSNLFFPKSLNKERIDGILTEYLNAEEQHAPNLNFVELIVNWPRRNKLSYTPAPAVRVLAKNRSRELSSELFSPEGGIRYGVELAIDPNQLEIKTASYDDGLFTLRFGGKWLSQYLDFATIMTNFIYVFEILDTEGQMVMAAHENDISTLMKTIGMHGIDEYPESMIFNTRNNQGLLSVLSYARFLESKDIRIEEAIEWVYNTYIEDEFGISGFSLSLPAAGSNWLDKCKGVGPEIERALKAFVLYEENGSIDSSYFEYMTVPPNFKIKSLLSDKYAVPAESFKKYAWHLFSDQSRVAHSENHPDCVPCFYEMLVNEHVSLDDFPEFYHSILDLLMANGFVEVREANRLWPTARSVCMRRIWQYGAINMTRLSRADKEIVDRLVNEGILSYSSNLFTQDEADYLSFSLNNNKFGNAWALRNKYDHASGSAFDDTEDQMVQDYYQMLLILIAITLKINEELCLQTGKGAIEEFVEWPSSRD